MEGQVPVYIPQEQDGPVQSQSHVTTEVQSVSQYVLVSSPRGFRGAVFERILIRHHEGFIKAKVLMLPLGDLHVKHAVQRGILVPNQPLL
jgi:hypothetical protein